MKKWKIITVGLSASLVSLSPLQAQGLFGERYFGFDGGWERIENGVSDDGWSFGAELNLPFPEVLPRGPFGADANFRFDYTRVWERDILHAEGVVREYMLPIHGFSPFAGVGFGWIDFDDVDTTYLPVEAGLELVAGPTAFVPFFRYSFAFDRAVDNFWMAGMNSVFWLSSGLGLTVKLSYTEYNGIDGVESLDKRIGARVGLIFAY